MKSADDTAMIPYFVHESEMTRMEKINKRWFIAFLIVFLAFVGTNVGWLIYESQFQEVVVSNEVDTGEGSATVFGVGIGDVTYGEGETGDPGSR